MRKGVFTVVAVVAFLVCLLYCGGEEEKNAYGFGIFNLDQKFGKLRGDNRNYYFYQLAYAREKTLVKNLCLLMEPFVKYRGAFLGAEYNRGRI